MDSGFSGERFSCVLVGADSLLIECGEILLGSGHEIAAVVAGSRKVASWAAGKSLAVIDEGSGNGCSWGRELSGLHFDWLFAITHLAIIPEEVLTLPRKGAINFHDGPLPRYAGLNAPAWALIEGAASYGVTWHLMTEGVDEGDIVASRSFEIDSGETSLSINTRNFEAAIDSFQELIAGLAIDVVKEIPQDPTAQRAFYRRADRPTAFCLIDWRQPADAIERMVRALDFGPYPNPIGRAAIRLNGTALNVTQATLRQEIQGRPGHVIDIVPGEIIVACGWGGLALKALATPSGQSLSPMEAAHHLGLSVGDSLEIENEDFAALNSVSTRLAKNELAQARRLTDLDPVILPWARTRETGREARFESQHVGVPPEFSEKWGGQAEAALVGAFGLVLARIAGKERVCLAAVNATVVNDVSVAGDLVSAWAPCELRLDMQHNFHLLTQAASDEIRRLAERGGFSADLIAREPELGRRFKSGSQAPVAIGLRINAPGQPERGRVAELALSEGRCQLRYDADMVEPKDAGILVDCLEHVLREMCRDPDVSIGQVGILSSRTHSKVLKDWNATRAAVPELCVHSAIEQQVDRSPDAVAAIFEDNPITYDDLDRRANQLAAHLRSLGIGPDRLVGIHVERSIELLVSVLAVLKAGGAYVPLDPTYPADRLQHMISDSGCAVLLTTSGSAESLASCQLKQVTVVAVDDAGRIGQHSTHRMPCEVKPGNLCYCIYTSGSTGLPKGVLIEHQNVINFFAGMDERVERTSPAVWLAVTSLSFDISVLELLYTLSRGFTVVIYRDGDKSKVSVGAGAQVADNPVERTGVDFSLFYFSGSEADSPGSEKYRLLLDGARWADANGLCAVWTPERHFHAFGGLYPQPAVTAAAVAAVTKNVSVRAGSVVMPLHHPIRVAEAWSIVDNLSNGRAAISIASGWQPDDFVLMPENYANAKDVMFRNTEIVQKLWRGEKVAFPGPLGKDVEVQTLPRPVQAELPIWVTTAGNPETFQQAGRIGANILTHLLGQTIEQLEPKIAAYRQARTEAGFDPDQGIVSLMLHTFISDDEETARETVREPLKAYLGTSLSLLKHYAWTFPAFKKPKSGEVAGGDELAGLTEAERDAILEFAFLRYYETSGLFGTPSTAQGMVDSLKAIGVNDVACLIDFGIDTDTVLASLPNLGVLCSRNRLAASTHKTDEADTAAAWLDQSITAQLTRHGVTHMQCTPSMARLLTLQEDAKAALAKVPNIFIGGEAFPVGLAKDLSGLAAGGRVTNMYGPTETTIWSTTWTLHGDLESVPIGTPIANTAIYILDSQRQPLPPGVPGELWIGGRGVARGYHQRPELTSERFVADPFIGGSARMYRTGDLARWKQLEDGSGVIEFLGRIDHQVKIRGYRIELGEVEARLAQYPAIRECVVVARPDPAGDQQLVAFISARSGHAVDPGEVREYLRGLLPEAMVPAHIIVLSSLPHTLNGKIDRNALPTLSELQSRRPITVPTVAAESELEQKVLAAWHKTLGDDSIRVNDNFFDVGGHSLLVVRLHRTLRDVLKQPVALTDLYRFPTVRSFVASLSADTSAVAAQRGLDRAARRRESLQRRNPLH